jgi:hypothetical protein
MNRKWEKLVDSNAVFARTRLSFQALATVAVIACARTPANTSTAPASAGFSLIREPECYNMSYRDSSATASARLFPTWIELFPGRDAGAAAGRHHATISEADWNALLKYSGWKRIAGDSLEIMFTGTAEGIRIHAARLNSSLSGRATWLTDLVGFTTPSLELVGTRESCP